jgi:hypothetical protein
MPVEIHPRHPVVGDGDGGFRAVQITDDDDEQAGLLGVAVSRDAFNNGTSYEFVRLSGGGVEWVDEPTDLVREEVED